MRHLAKLAAAGVATALIASACGATNVLQGKTPDQIVQLASAKVTGESYRMVLDGRFDVDVSQVQGLPAGVTDAFTRTLKQFTMSGTANVESASRLRMAMTMSIAGTTKNIVAVLYDNHYYLSLDNGKSFADVGTFNLQGIASSPSDIQTLLSQAANVQDLGATTHNGQRVEHLHATFGPNYLNDMLDKITHSSTGQLGSGFQEIQQLFREVFTLQKSAVDIYVRDVDGRVESMDTAATMAIDMGKLMRTVLNNLGGQGAPGLDLNAITGSVLMNMTMEARFSDYGAKITVAKPPVDPNAPGLNDIFGGANTGA